MRKGLEALMRNVLGLKEEKSVVGVMSGQLLKDWREFAFQKSQLNMQRRLSLEQFALEFFERREGEWWDRDGLVEQTSAAYKSERAAEITEYECRKAGIDALEERLWKLIYETFGLNPNDSHSTNMDTGEVFKSEVKLDA